MEKPLDGGRKKLECLNAFAPEWTYLRAVAEAGNVEALRAEESSLRKFLDETFLSWAGPEEREIAKDKMYAIGRAIYEITENERTDA